jgi:glycosyltransferase involved in cell wall biosynthesis
MRASCDISIIVPSFKRPEKLARALASIANASSRPHEIILVDDCADGSAFAIGKQFGARYFLKAGVDQGLSDSRNIGLKLARGRYVLFLDDDDFLLPGSIDQLYDVMGKDTGFAYGDPVFMHNDKSTLESLRGLTHDDLLVSNQIPVGAYLIEKAMIAQVFDVRLKSHEDWDFILGNADWNRARHVHRRVVVIDKTEIGAASHQARRRNKFWLDFFYMYVRYPAPHLTHRRKQQLLALGVNLGNLDIEN